MKYRVYLAAPFFYPAQIELVERMEKIIEEAGYELFSPRRVMVLGKNASQEDRKRVWEANVQGLESADIVVAQIAGLGRRAHDVIEGKLKESVDYYKAREAESSERHGGASDLTVRTSVRCRTAEQIEEKVRAVLNSPAFPAYADEGVLWEIGYAAALRRMVRRAVDSGLDACPFLNIVLYVPDASVRINVMLTGDASEVVVGDPTLLPDAFQRVLKGVVTPWQGPTQ